MWARTSALRYSRADQIVPRDCWTSEVSDDLPADTLLYTTSVTHVPRSGRIESLLRSPDRHRNAKCAFGIKSSRVERAATNVA
jgi:hypothetical protein